MRRSLLLGLVLGCVALTGPSHDVTFVQPLRVVWLAGPAGVSVPIQVRVHRHKENRFLDLEVWLDELRVDGYADPIDADEDAAVFPSNAGPHWTPKLGPGRYVVLARACRGSEERDGRTVCRDARAFGRKAFTVCAGSDLDGC